MADITGNVKQDAVNAEGIEVTAVTDVTSGSETVVASAVTDANGDYTLTGLGSTPVIVTAREDRGIAWPASTAVNLGDRVYSTNSLSNNPESLIIDFENDFVPLFAKDGVTITPTTSLAIAGTSPSAAVHGTAGCSFPQSGIDYLIVENFDVSGDFTIELFANISTGDTTALFEGRHIAPTSDGFHIYRAGDTYSFGVERASWDWLDMPISNGVHYLAWCREGSTVRAYFDGTLMASKTYTDAFPNTRALIGTNIAFDASHIMHDIDDLRLSTYAKYTGSSHTVPTSGPSLALPAFAYVFDCTTAGTTGATEPAWNTTGTTNDGTAVWTAKPYFRPISHGPVIPE